MTCRYLNCPSGPVIGMRRVITMSALEGVKTQLVHKGQAFNILEDLRFSLQGSWTYNLSTSAEFMSHSPVENINQSLPEAHHSMAANPINILSSWQTRSLSFSSVSIIIISKVGKTLFEITTSFSQFHLDFKCFTFGWFSVLPRIHNNT